MTTTGSILFLIEDFSLVKLIDDVIHDDAWISGPLPLLGFDEDIFPFILLPGFFCLSILNVKTGEHKPLINMQFLAFLGITCAFVKKEDYG